MGKNRNPSNLMSLLKVETKEEAEVKKEAEEEDSSSNNREMTRKRTVIQRWLALLTVGRLCPAAQAVSSGWVYVLS